MSRVLALRLWPGHLLALVLTIATLLLGLWQLHAWQERREAEARDLTHAAPVALGQVMGPDDPFPGLSVGQPVDLSGTWIPDATVFVSGREHRGVDGFWMVTPLAIGAPSEASSDPALPVVLGWVRDPATAPAPPEGSEAMVGWLQPPEGTGDRDPDPSDDVLPQLRTADIVQRVDQDLYSGYAVARDGVDGLPAGDLEALPDAGRFTAVRNLLYGIEWWVFGGFVVLMWWRWVGEQLEPPAALDDEDVEDDEQPAAKAGRVP